MLPAIHPGVRVPVYPLSGTPEQNMICLCEQEAALILHRVIEPPGKNAPFVWVKGDHHQCVKEKIPINRILGYSPDQEAQILTIIASRFHPDHPRLQQLAAPKHTEELIKYALQRGIGQQLIHWIDQKNPLPQSTPVKKAWQLALQAKIRNQLLIKRFQEISSSFQEQNIACTPIKGLWLLLQDQWGDWFRTTSDLDILVAEKDLKVAAKILETLGYIQDPAKNGRKNYGGTAGGHHLIPFRKNGLSTELHYRAFPDIHPLLNTMLLEQYSPTAQCIVILCHFTRHLQRGDYQLKWVADLMRLAGSLSTDKLITLCQQTLSWKNHPLELQLLDWLVQWKNRPVSAPQIDELRHLIHSGYHQEGGAREMLVRHYPVNYRGLKNLLLTAFPHPRYVRFTSGDNRKSIARLYLLRWTELIRKMARHIRFRFG